MDVGAFRSRSSSALLAARQTKRLTVAEGINLARSRSHPLQVGWTSRRVGAESKPGGPGRLSYPRLSAHRDLPQPTPACHTNKKLCGRCANCVEYRRALCSGASRFSTKHRLRTWNASCQGPCMRRRITPLTAARLNVAATAPKMRRLARLVSPTALLTTVDHDEPHAHRGHGTRAEQVKARHRQIGCNTLLSSNSPRRTGQTRT